MTSLILSRKPHPPTIFALQRSLLASERPPSLYALTRSQLPRVLETSISITCEEAPSTLKRDTPPSEVRLSARAGGAGPLSISVTVALVPTPMLQLAVGPTKNDAISLPSASVSSI